MGSALQDPKCTDSIFACAGWFPCADVDLPVVAVPQSRSSRLCQKSTAGERPAERRLWLLNSASAERVGHVTNAFSSSQANLPTTHLETNFPLQQKLPKGLASLSPSQYFASTNDENSIVCVPELLLGYVPKMPPQKPLNQSVSAPHSVAVH